MLNIYYNFDYLKHVYDLINYLSIIIVLIYLYKKKVVSLNHLLLLGVYCATPFVFNDIIFSSEVFPDQSKYYGQAIDFRSRGLLESYNMIDKFDNVWFASLIYSIFPVLSFESVNTIAFINKSIIVFLFIFFKKKNIANIFIYTLLFYPSIIVYSSLALRDVMIIFFMIMSAYFFFEKKYLWLIISCFILYLIKEESAFFIIGNLLFYKILGKASNINKYFIISLTLAIIIYFLPEIYEKINYIRIGFFHEIRGYGDGLTKIYIDDIKLNYNLDGILKILLTYIKSFFYPITSSLTIIYAILTADNLIFTLLYFTNCAYLYKHQKYKVTYWLLSYFLINLIISITVFNEITLLRYKMSWNIFYIFCLNYNHKNNNFNNKKIQ